MKIEYECWKCPEWHADISIRGMLECIRYGFGRVRITIWKLKVTIPNVVGFFRFLPYKIKNLTEGNK
jgi:hypothetical protein